jgi:hypothetical protein
LGPKCGFQKITSNATSSDNRLLSRQDLIRLATNGSNGITTNALPYLTHFSRAVSAPSLSPTTSTAANRFLPNVRVSGDFKRLASGEPAVKGEPLLKYRFPLSRFAGIGRTGPNTSGNTTLDDGDLSEANIDTIRRDFGLYWDEVGKQWVYTGPTGVEALNTIANLSAISDREPNFFELLKASILDESLGKDSSDQITKNEQIIQIGINIIDQYDGDSFPTSCKFNNKNFYGIENLPYLNRVFMNFVREDANIKAYWNCEVWNLHRGKPPSPAVDLPSKIRFTATNGNSTAVFQNASENISAAQVGHNNSNAVEFDVPADTFPKLIEPGLLAGLVPSIVKPTDDEYKRLEPADDDPPYGTLKIVADNIDFSLQYKFNDEWYPYQEWKGISVDLLKDNNGNRSDAEKNLSPGCFIQGADPRSGRFGIAGDILPKNKRAIDWSILEPLPPNAPSNKVLKASADIWDKYYPFDLQNLSKSGDAINSTGNSTDPLHPTGLSSRPVILNRPFRSVADLGYAFRDLPFKTLDLFTANSADSGLLDVFCVNESSVSGMTAGVTNPNTRHAPVLRALVFNSLKNELPPEDRITSTGNEDLLIANAISSTTSTASVKTPNELARVVNAIDAFAPGSTDPEIKARRESVVRALADVSNTRTWNVMVDLVVQSGRYANAATDVDKFTVDGERRMWVHLAIDRYTGQVIARSTEIVNE